MKAIKALSIFSLLISLSHSSYAGDVEGAYRYLRSRPVNYEVFGTVCEELAMVRVRKRFPESNYRVTGGLVYGDKQRTIGELDLVIFDLNSREAVVIGEVKCWRNLAQGRKKAISQLRRFHDTIESRRPFEIHKGSEGFNPNQFDENPDMILISQDGGLNKGFDLTIGFTLDEVILLHNKLKSHFLPTPF